MAQLVLADDSAAVQKVIQLAFASEKIQVRCFSDGRQALRFLKAQPVDILLADVRLPLLDGYQLCRQVKRDSRTAAIPVILLGSIQQPCDAQLARQVGADKELAKPLELTRLVQLVKRLLASRQPLRASSKRIPSRVPRSVPASLHLYQPPGLDSGWASRLFSLDLSQCRPELAGSRRPSGEMGRGGGEDKTCGVPPLELLQSLSHRLRNQLLPELRQLLPGALRHLPDQSGSPD